MVIYTKLEINNVEYANSKQIQINKNMNEFNSLSNFVIEFDNRNGQYDDTFSLNQDVEIWADIDTSPATTKIFLGVIEDIQFKGSLNKESIILSGRDYAAILQDIIVNPRIFKNDDASDIVISLINQNAANKGITVDNVNTSSVTVDRITFNNISLFDAIAQLSEIAGFYFFIDTNKDLNFLQRNNISSGITFDNTNVTSADFKQTDNDIFNKVTVYGARQLTGVRQTFSPQAGSVYVLDDKPSNVIVTGSASLNVPIQPGGINGVNDPETENVQFLVNYNARSVILTSGITAGDNLGWIGSPIIIDYQRSSPLISIKSDSNSQANYGQKDKVIIDKNIKEQDEAVLKAETFLAEHKDPVIQGKINVYGVIDVTPGNTATINIPFHNIKNQTYMILNTKYTFNSTNNLSNNVLTVTLNKKIKNFIDYMKDQELRLRNLEGSEVDTFVTSVELQTGSVSVETSFNAISRSIGSAFYFHVPGHNLLNSTSSLLGDMRAGSEVISG